VACRVLPCFAVSGCLLFAQQVIREAPISAFPQLPETVRNDLRTRACTVPQPPAYKTLANVIRGHFRDPRHIDWAVVCDSGAKKTSMLLVYWGDNPSQPAIVYPSKLSNGNCWTEIIPVGESFIMEHYRVYGGPKPPPIDHEGINVGICDKASTVSYFYRNRWLTLTGAD
jgi:hypothetical protein